MEVIIAVIGSSALAALISGIFQLITTREKKKDGVRDGVRQLLYDRLKFLGRKYIAQGWITSEDLSDFLKMHEIYHGPMSGNGYLDIIVEQVKELPVRQIAD